MRADQSWARPGWDDLNVYDYVRHRDPAARQPDLDRRATRDMEVAITEGRLVVRQMTKAERAAYDARARAQEMARASNRDDGTRGPCLGPV